jgi:hypothetical protein
MAIDDDDYAKACAKLATYPKHILDSVRVPSKYTMRRFVRVFFRHVARHVPIVHEPTFSLAAASCEYSMRVPYGITLSSAGFDTQFLE